MTCMVKFSLAILLILCGCFKSIHPVFKDKDLITNPSFSGRWSGGKNQDIFAVSPDSNKTYLIEIIKNGTDMPAMFGDKIYARLGKIGKVQYIETYAEQKINDLMAYDLPCYMFAKISFIDSNKIAIAWPDADWILKNIDIGNKDSRIYTARTTDEVQKIILKLGDNHFMKPETLSRVMETH